MIDWFEVAFSIALMSKAAGTVACATVIALILFTKKKFGLWVNLPEHIGPQRIHDQQTPRIGGVAVLGGVLVAVILNWPESEFLLMVMLFSCPIISAGLIEDLTNAVPAFTRLLLSFFSAVFVVYFADVFITNTGFRPFDLLISLPLMAGIFSIISITSLCHGMNIIDGLNGLASGASLFMLTSIAFLARAYGDDVTLALSIAILFPLFGFMVFNFPKGLIFLGDGGAYFLGMMVALLVILLPSRIPEISSFASLLIVSYPIYELLRSYFRRFKVSVHQLMLPDDNHLHSLMFKVIDRKMLLSGYVKNSLASTCVLVFPLYSCILAFNFHGDVMVLLVALCAQLIAYEFVTLLLKRQIRKFEAK